MDFNRKNVLTECVLLYKRYKRMSGNRGGNIECILIAKMLSLIVARHLYNFAFLLFFINDFENIIYYQCAPLLKKNNIFFVQMVTLLLNKANQGNSYPIISSISHRSEIYFVFIFIRAGRIITCPKYFGLPFQFLCRSALDRM